MKGSLKFLLNSTEMLEPSVGRVDEEFIMVSKALTGGAFCKGNVTNVTVHGCHNQMVREFGNKEHDILK